MFNNTTGCNNVAVGRNSLYTNTTGTRNIAVGACSLGYNVIGNNNTAIGHHSLYCNIGSSNTAVGYRSQREVSGNTNTIAVGCCAQTSATNGHTIWGNASNNVCNCYYVAWSIASDCRDKTNIQTLPSKLGLDLIKKLRPVP